MPELPEVETTVRGISPYLVGHKIRKLVVRERRLRWPISAGLEQRASGKKVVSLYRRGKYIVVEFPAGGMIIHLGMSGSMRVLLQPELPGKHDHFDIVNHNDEIIRFRDPRRFGCLLHSREDIATHPRLTGLGVEPMGNEFTATLLYDLSHKRKVSVKAFIMDASTVVGIGNIYASEVLFLSGIHPVRNCSKISRSRYQLLTDAIREVLGEAIAKGGTTLQDFVGADGSPGYFDQKLRVYNREGETCCHCSGRIMKTVIGQRSTFYCPGCQT